jgi:hypothetical protein
MSEMLNLESISVLLPTSHKSGGSDAHLQLSPISVKEEYRKKWNIHENDFVCLTKNGELVSNSLYRVGGLGTPNLEKDNYFMLIKHVEAYYEDKITKIKKDKPHLEGRWCIIDKHGIEKVEVQPFRHPYLVKNSCIYSLEQKYYNIETKEFYCYTSNRMESSEFLFLENRFDDDKSKCGVMKINKNDGTFELFK